MTKACIAACLLALAACSAPPARRAATTPCDVHEASYECQIERYHNVNVP
jgi:hypothetical protein